MQEIQNKKLVVVLGMHRSGTSAVTRSLKTLGVDLGNALVPPVADDNDKGFWEDADTLSINQDLMAALGVGWCPLSPYTWSKIDAEQMKVFERQATELLKNKLSNVDAFGIKDPRLTRLLPFWQPIFDQVGVDVRYVLVVRNPLSVAASLKRRNNFADFRSHLLWLRHVVPSFLDTYGLPRVVVSYERMMSDPRGQLRRIASGLDMFLDEDSQAFADYTDDFLSHELQRAYHKTDELGQSSVGARLYLRRIYEALEGVASNQVRDPDPSIKRLFLDTAQYLASFEDSLAYIDQIEDRSEELRLDVPREVAQRLADLETAYDKLVQGQKWLESQRKAWKRLASSKERRIDELSALIAENEKDRAELESVCGSLREGQAWLQSQRDTWEELASTRERRVDELSTLVEEKEKARAELESAYGALTKGQAWLRQQLGAWEQQAAAKGRRIDELTALVEENGKALAELESAYSDLREGHAWLQSQRDAWEELASAKERRIGELSLIVNAYEKNIAWLESQRQAWESRSKAFESRLVDLEQQLSGQK
jgi:hypothetical protein